MPAVGVEGWTALAIVGALLLGGVVGKVWSPMRKMVSAIDVVAGRPERYPGDEEARPGLVERLDRIDHAFHQLGTKVDVVGDRVEKLERDWES